MSPVLASFCMVAIVATMCSAATIHVASANGTDNSNCGELQNPCSTIQYAVSELSAANDTVILLPGIHHTPASGIYVDRSITVQGSSNVTVDCGGEGRAFQLNAPGATLSALTIRNCGGADIGFGGGVLVNSRATLENMVIEQCSATLGGGLQRLQIKL